MWYTVSYVFLVLPQHLHACLPAPIPPATFLLHLPRPTLLHRGLLVWFHMRLPHTCRCRTHAVRRTLHTAHLPRTRFHTACRTATVRYYWIRSTCVRCLPAVDADAPRFCRTPRARVLPRRAPYPTCTHRFSLLLPNLPFHCHYRGSLGRSTAFLLLRHCSTALPHAVPAATHARRFLLLLRGMDCRRHPLPYPAAFWFRSHTNATRRLHHRLRAYLHCTRITPFCSLILPATLRFCFRIHLYILLRFCLPLRFRHRARHRFHRTTCLVGLRTPLAFVSFAFLFLHFCFPLPFWATHAFCWEGHSCLATFFPSLLFLCLPMPAYHPNNNQSVGNNVSSILCPQHS